MTTVSTRNLRWTVLALLVSVNLGLPVCVRANSVTEEFEKQSNNSAKRWEEFSHEEAFGLFTEICGLGKLNDALCWCGYGIVLIDHEGKGLPVSIGPSRDNPHTGFRIGSISSSNPTAWCVPIGSPEEGILENKIWEYLNSVFGTVEEAEKARVTNKSELKKEFIYPAYLYDLLRYYDNCSENREWVEARFSKEDQDRIIATPFNDLEIESEKEAYRRICSMYGNGLASRTDQIVDFEFGLREDQVWCAETY